MTHCCQCENQVLVSIESQCDLCQGQIFSELQNAFNELQVEHLLEEWYAWETIPASYAA